MTKTTLHVGLDTDKKHIDVAVAEPLPGGEVRYWGKIANRPDRVEHLLKRLGREGRELVLCYEAGPCGYGLYRQLHGRPGVSCIVVAPSLIPRRPGERVKTNRRDAMSLARLLRAEELTAVWVPDRRHEAIRDLVRARGAAMADLTRCRQRIRSFLLRQGLEHEGKAWTKKHRRWLGGLRFEEPAHGVMWSEMLIALDQARERCDRLVDHIGEQVADWSLGWLVEALQVLRGYGLLNAATMVSEIGDPRRFESPRQLMAFVGLVLSEHSTGDKVRRGGITRTGNARARKAAIEAAWTYARPASRQAAPQTHAPELHAIADKARHRLSRRYRQLADRGKLRQVAATAIARESLGFIWAIAHAAAPDRQT